jgi:ubiquitin-conjugating enzyme E2 J2
MDTLPISQITIKRIGGDFKLFKKTNPLYFDVIPNDDNILEIHFLMWGHPGTPYEGGQYIGKIVHNPEYPRKAPDYYMLTPSGRFNINAKICLTNSGFHQLDWAPAAWNLVSILEGFSSVFHSDISEDKAGISHISNTPVAEIKKLAAASVEYNMSHLNNIYGQFPKIISRYNPYATPIQDTITVHVKADLGEKCALDNV